MFISKKILKPLEEYYDMANELKVIVYQDSDFRWAERISSKIKKMPSESYNQNGL